MQIKITKTDGMYKEVTGDIEYHDTYITIKYKDYNDKGVLIGWIEIAIPWRLIHEVEVRP